MTLRELRDEGWHSIDCGELPSPSAIVEFAREEQVHRQLPWFGRWAELDPAFNVAGLWWRMPS